MYKRQLHAGGSPQAYEFIKSRGVTALDCVNGPYEGTLFWRDQERRRSAGLEHSVLTSSETIQELLPTYQRVRLDHEEGFQVGWTFQEGPEAGGEAAEILTVPFSTYKTGVFEYDPDSGLYLVEEYGEPYVDGNTGEQVAVKNVLVLYTDVSQLSGDSAGRLKVRTTGSGGGLLVRDGLAWPITWEREGESDRLSFYREDGQPAALGAVSYTHLDVYKRQVQLGEDAIPHLGLDGDVLTVDGVPFQGPVVYTGAADELFGRRFGPLPYRTLDFRFETLDQTWFQSRGTVNYTVDQPYTRITEFKHMTGQELEGRTTIVKEFSRAYTGAPEETPYYAIINGENNALYARYRALAERFPNLHLLGRLAEYKYYNMDAIVARALELAGQLI